MDLETARILKCIHVRKAILDLGTGKGCFDYTAFEKALAAGMTAEPTFRVSFLF